MTLHLDFETRSAVDLRKAGAYVYAEDPTTDIWCAAYALGEEEPRLWLPGDPVPEDVEDHIRSGGTVTAHNAAFERVIWRAIFARRYGWPEPKLEQYRCTMAMAYALAMPGGLDDLAAALGLDYRKDDKGYRVMLQMSKPRRVEADGTIVWWDDAERKARLYAYCKQDVVVEREVEKRLLPLTKYEQRVWQMDQRINDRGVWVDVELCEAAKDMAAETKKRLDKEMREVTDREVASCTATAQLREWIEKRGFDTPGVAKEDVEALLGRDDLPDDVRRALELRQQGSRTSTAKIDALLNGRSPDGRARGLMQYHAASTGRWGGRRFQPQNLKRPDENTDIEQAIGLLLNRDLDAMLKVHDDPISIIGDCLRGLIAAPDGRILRAADFSNIEGRVLAWLASEQWKLDAFAAFDRGEGEDLYKVTAGSILEKPAPEVTKPERQSIGKVSELALGFQGGVGAMMTMSGGRVDFGALYPMLSGKLPGHAERAEEAFEQRGRGMGLGHRSWVAMEIVKLAWREKNAKIAGFWPLVEEAAIRALSEPGEVFRCGYLRFRKVGSWLFMQLPSGRCLAYAYPRLEDDVTPWGSPIKKIKFKGVDSRTRKWSLQDTYGGKLVENATQAVARDILTHSLLRLDAEGWTPVLHVHDEAVCDTRESFGSTEALEALMADTPEWLQGCPVSAEGWSERRYRK